MMKIIADVGSNWETPDDLEASIREAKAAGATAVKFQCFTEQDLYGYPITHKNQCDIEQYLPHLKRYSDDVCIEFICTFFRPEKLKKYQNLLTTIKIASCDLNYPELLKVANETKKPVLLSIAGAYTPDIDQALDYLEDCKTTLLYCHGEYPSKTHNLTEITILRLLYLKSNDSNEVGYSDHTIDIFTPYTAAHHYGCRVIEKHFKIRDMDTPDNGHSLNPKDFKMMVNLINSQDIGSDTKEQFCSQHTRRLVATCDIKEGETFVYNINYGAYRTPEPTPEAINAFDDITGFKATKDIAAWSALTYDNVR
jgi:sialic acid synthase SpsE